MTTGIIGTSLGAIAAAGGLGGILGLGPRPPMDPGNRPVSRYEMGLMNENRDLRDEITALNAASYTDRRAGELQREIDGQGAVNAAMTATIQNQQGQINQLLGITKLVVPNDNVSPGWGRANVQPAPPEVTTFPWTRSAIPSRIAAAPSPFPSRFRGFSAPRRQRPSRWPPPTLTNCANTLRRRNMKIIQEISAYIKSELNDAKAYATDALMSKDTDKELAATYYALSQQEVEEREQLAKEQEQAREDLELLNVKATLAAVTLAEATANAMARIPDTHCNGDMRSALEYATKASETS